ncbi:metal ABC transporter solute-binding protein, Zn/Mn family [Fulvivirga lutea]|uniref:Zinc ABC transporter substrate-binding protein n=1 Tax=Fulvivirga lutea TaxID=2810512 RepID=A0A974ZZU4_9BACT|nr:zinc ABC transporter substrate-binding protein [Fulvivirga lutea]QSE96669.1 zinc ABC transporter substrate-binding protein [Fulvivirga lutea]
MGYRLIILFIVLMAACKPTDKEEGKLQIVTTTGMIADAVKNIVGETADVEALMGPGVDPHLYKATQGDLQRLTRADIIFYNGLHLEGKMGEVLEKLSRQRPVIAVAAEIDTTLLFRVPQFNNNYDPHIWFDVSLWSTAVKHITKSMIEQQPQNENLYKTNEAAYINKLDSLHKMVTEEMASIPPMQRVLITAHDAFGYFGKAYDIEVKGLQGISTISEYGLRDVSDLVDFIIERKIKAVFVETSVSEKAINAVVQGCKESGFDVQIGGNLYSDAMGPAGTPEGTYIGMVKANVSTIVNALK